MAIVTSFPLGQQSAEATQALHDDIRNRWSRLTDRDVGALKDNDDLVNKVVGLYGLPRATAQSDVTALLKARTL